jgi:hypothetical protein
LSGLPSISAGLSDAGEALAGLLDGARGGVGNCLAVLNHVLQALTHQSALNGCELLHRLGAGELGQALQIALELLLAEIEQVAGGILEGLAENGAAAGDSFHVLLRR